MNYDPAEFYRLCEDVPTEEEMDLALEMMLEAIAEDEANSLKEEK